jgi:hypothetical protein
MRPFIAGEMSRLVLADRDSARCCTNASRVKQATPILSKQEIEGAAMYPTSTIVGTLIVDPRAGRTSRARRSRRGSHAVYARAAITPRAGHDHPPCRPCDGRRHERRARPRLSLTSAGLSEQASTA